jgi:uncharacterized phage protein (TIGR01671 family)
MREIRFRAWDPIKKKMHYAEGDKFVIQFGGKIGRFNGIHYNTEEWELMQFTGIKDRNGKNIYESDIIRVDDNYDKFGFAAAAKCEVIFDKGKFMMYDKESGGKWYFEDNETNYIEVIGTIHKTPELL